MDENDYRIDKFLWAVRIYKTRSIATDEINKNRISIDGVNVKPSRKVKQGETIVVRKPPVTYTFLVKELLSKRVGAPLVARYIEDVTPTSELEKRELLQHSMNFTRDRGMGRPTKRDRRDIDRVKENDNDSDNWDD
jgi:ribosome-associated heat shock protein Hsp15